MPRDQPVVRGDDSSYAEGRGCYTTALINRGRARFAERHASRLQRDARLLRLGAVERDTVLRAFEELGKAAFPDGEGIIRVQATRDGDGELHLVGVPRELEPSDGHPWLAIVSDLLHEGPTAWSGCKVTNRLVFALGRDAAAEAGADEAILFDASGMLVEGSRSCLFVVGRDGALGTPPLSRGGVASIAREVVMEHIPQVEARDITLPDLREADEIIAVNAVRGARPIGTLDGRPIGSGHLRWAELLDRALSTE
ncbi:MAG: aminotransferase class IV [Myxococcales bacterium]|nr:aminotransferase class IV [Myxococcales bacterium]